MKLKDFLEELSWGEFSNIALGNEGSGVIAPEKIPLVVAILNDGLVQMYSQFMLKEGNVLVEMKDNITYYVLDSKYAESSYDPLMVAYPYIKDTKEDPFRDDVLKILEVIDQDGNHYPINNHDHPFGVFITDKLNVLQIPKPKDGVGLGVRYQAAHEKLDAENLEGELSIPLPLRAALKYYIASRIYQNMNMEGALRTSSVYESKYKELLAQVTLTDSLSTSEVRAADKFTLRGWV